MVHINKKISNNGVLSLSACLKFEEIYLNDLKEKLLKNLFKLNPNLLG